jgi:2'-5' RNA ligase
VPAELGTLYREIEANIVSLGIVPESRPFRPHITIARLANASHRSVAEYLERNDSFRAGPFPVTSFTLFSSVLTQQGPIHTLETSYPLTPSSP